MAESKATAEKKEKFPEPPPVALAPTPLPALTSEQSKALGAAFLKDQAALDKAEAAYEAARSQRSSSIQAIVTALGHKGPFNIGGKNWSAKQAKSTGNWTMVEQATAKDTLG